MLDEGEKNLAQSGLFETKFGRVALVRASEECEPSRVGVPHFFLAERRRRILAFLP